MSMESSPNAKRPAPSDDGPPSKKIKPLPEVPAQYSDAVRKKLAATSRTGQACDRCKERKMKCDTDPAACQPCRQKNLRCFTTDRVTGRARERGQSDRAESEVYYLREQIVAYQTKYGLLQPEDMPPPQPSTARVSSTYVGWPVPDHNEPLHKGPVNGTKVDILDGVVDVCDFPSDLMEPPARGQMDVFNLSRTSIINTIFGFQRINDPKLPPEEETMQQIDNFLVVMSQFVPILHRSSMKEQTLRLYEEPDSITLPERVQILAVLGILAYQQGLRNYVMSAENIAKSHRYIHSALGFYRNIYHDVTLPAMQALALLVVHFRNMPAPGVTWSFSNQVLVRLIELRYHRDPDKIVLPPNERTPLAKELRKRVFHSVLTVCTTTGCRIGLPTPWPISQMDVPLPEALCDSELSADGISADRSGSCDFHPCLQLSRQLPLWTEMYDHVISVRRPPAEYVRIVEALNTKILAWRQHWEDSTKHEKPNPNLLVATLLVEQWMAEYQMILHHPACCTSTSPEILDRNLDISHKAAKRLLQAFHTLSSKYKGVDFTWHSTQAYAMGFGITLYVYRKRKGAISLEQYQNMVNELNGWMSCMAYADVVLKTNNHLQRIFQPRRQTLDEEYRGLIIDPSPPRPQTQHSLQSIHTSNLQQLQTESTPQATSKVINPSSAAFEGMQQSPAMQTSNVAMSPIYAGMQHPQHQSRASYPSSPWQQPVHQPHPALQYQGSSLPYPASPYSQHSQPPQQSPHMAPASQPQQYPQQSPHIPPATQPQYPQHISTSLAPIVHPNASYASYSGASQGHTPTAAVPMVDYSQMAFNQGHYYGDGPSSMAWPMVTMPPGPPPQ